MMNLVMADVESRNM